MPVISVFYGIIIFFYYADNRKHHSPHFHAQYAEFEAVIAIDDGYILEGELPGAKMKLVQAWVEIHKEELKFNWGLAVSGKKPNRIKPLK
jgi:hypothetical protein